MIFHVLRYGALSIDDESDFYQFRAMLRKLGDSPLCPHCRAPIGGKVWRPPYHITLKGEAYGDMCRGRGQQFLVSTRFVGAWHTSGLSGLEFSNEPASLRPWRKMQAVVPEYYVALPKHVLTWLDEVASGLQVAGVVRCDACRAVQRKKIERLRIDEDTWGGEDVFYPSGLYGVLVVTERFRQFVVSNGFTNFPFTHQDDYAKSRRR